MDIVERFVRGGKQIVNLKMSVLLPDWISVIVQKSKQGDLFDCIALIGERMKRGDSGVQFMIC